MPVPLAGTKSSTTFFQYFYSRVVKPFNHFKSSVFFLAGLAAFNILVVRSEEAENGICVFDANGNAVGVSKEAGFKV